MIQLFVMSSFCGSCFRQSESYWQPGQNLPSNSFSSHATNNCADDVESTTLVDILQTMQSSIDGQFTQSNSTLGQISTRLDALEGKQHSIEEAIKECQSPSLTSTSPSSCSESGGGKRKHRIPISLQVWKLIGINLCF